MELLTHHDDVYLANIGVAHTRRPVRSAGVKGRVPAGSITAADDSNIPQPWSLARRA
jgi:hypothetical protein